jgi:D-alanyl-D-alanine carboxypeptidase
MPVKSILPTRCLCLALALGSAAAFAQSRPTTLPEAVTTALARARVPLEAVSLLVVDADGKSAPRLSHRADAAMNPASVMKLVTTYAALDLLGPAYTWRTPVWLDGTVKDGVLKGNLHSRAGRPQAGTGAPVAAAAAGAGNWVCAALRATSCWTNSAFAVPDTPAGRL